MNSNSKILVLGARGLVGSALIRVLREEEGFTNILAPSRAEGDLTDPVWTRWYFSAHRPEYVFFCAAVVGGIADNISRKITFLEDNLRMELNVIAQCAAFDVKKLLFVSTSCVYPANCPQPMSPEFIWTGKLQPETEPYSIAKLAAMKLCEYHYERGRNFITAIPCNVFGERDNFDPETAHCLPGILARMHAAKTNNAPTFTIWGHGFQKREFIFAPDLARRLIFVMENYNESLPINVGTGFELSMRELAGLCQAEVGYEGKIQYDTARPVGAPRKVLDNHKLFRLGYAGTTPFTDALRLTYEWFRLHDSR